MNRCVHVTLTISCQPTPLLPSLLHLSPLHELTLLFTYLEILLLLLVVRMPIHSCPWLAINSSPLVVSPTPRHPIEQVTNLHRRNQHSYCLVYWEEGLGCALIKSTLGPGNPGGGCMGTCIFTTIPISIHLNFSLFCMYQSIHTTNMYPSNTHTLSSSYSL
jgi:hypothetical protein